MRKKTIISLIAACDQKNGIGKNNQLLWHLPADLQVFKQLTLDHCVIMGRKTFDSIGKALPRRINIVISRKQFDFGEGILAADSLENALQLAQNQEEVFIIGGAEIYSLALPWKPMLFFLFLIRKFGLKQAENSEPKTKKTNLIWILSCTKKRNFYKASKPYKSFKISLCGVDTALWFFHSSLFCVLTKQFWQKS
jgi:dihydrofolate reductase